MRFYMKALLFKKVEKMLTYVIIILVGILMVYPILWMFTASFKTNNEINLGTGLIPQKIVFNGLIDGWMGSGQYSFSTFFSNTFILVVPTVILTLISSTFVAYGFARFQFKFRKVLFVIMLSTLMVPSSVLIIPRYLLFRDFSWLNTYLPFWVSALLACNSFFIYQEVQFIRGIPRDLDEAATIDGCNSLGVLIRVLLPILQPSMISVCIFQSIWTWNDFMNPLIYISSVKKYPLSLALRMSLDVAADTNWNQVMALACVSILPLVVLFFCTQKYFVEGIATTGIKA